MKWTTGTSRPTGFTPPNQRKRGPVAAAVAWFRVQPFETRILISFAVALALLEAVAGLFPPPRPAPQSPTVVAVLISIRHRTPRPTPPPTPPPKRTPPPAVERTPRPRSTLASNVAVNARAPLAVATPHRAVGGAASRRRMTRALPHRVRATPQAVARAAATGAGQSEGGAGSGAGPGSGDGGLGGTGSGTGGNGGAADAAPCGDVTFFGRVDHIDPDGTVHEHVRIEVRLADGNVLGDELHWLWTYKSENDNPFDPKLPEEEVRMQLPPAGFDLSRQTEATIFALKHTTPNGITTLPACPSPPTARASTDGA